MKIQKQQLSHNVRPEQGNYISTLLQCKILTCIFLIIYWNGLLNAGKPLIYSMNESKRCKSCFTKETIMVNESLLYSYITFFEVWHVNGFSPQDRCHREEMLMTKQRNSSCEGRMAFVIDRPEHAARLIPHDRREAVSDRPVEHQCLGPSV